MKKTATILMIALFLKASLSQAQIPNSSFEHLNYDGTISNWGSVFLFPMWIDTSGSSYVDSIVFDNNWFYTLTNDAFLGSTAIELSNAWDYTTNLGIPGSITADTDSVFSAWGSFETFPIQMQPFNFSFYYKYLPVNNDSGVATLQLFDSMMNQVGEAVIIISGTVSNYTLATAPVIYTDTTPAAFAYINFRTAVYGSQASFGTRLLIDEVMFNYVTTIDIQEGSSGNALKIYPNPFTNELIIADYSLRENNIAEVFDIYGRKIYSGALQTTNTKLSTVDWESGIYFVRIAGQVLKVLKN